MPVCPASGKANLTGKQWTVFAGIGGGASGGAMAFCLCWPGSNPGTEMAFFGSELLFIYSHRLSLRTCNRTVHTPSSSSF